MRTQRRAARTVTIAAVAKSDDSDVGDSTETHTFTEVERAIFEPERPLERTGDGQALVVRPAMFNLPGVHDLDADDLILEGALDVVVVDDAIVGGTVVWQVVGGSTVWLDRTEVPVTRATNV